jgi:replicative DNA helicase
MMTPENSVAAENAEMHLIGCIFLRPEVLDDVAAIVQPSDMQDPANGIIYKRIIELREARKSVDPTLVTESLRSSGDLERAGGYAYIELAASSVLHVAHASYYAECVKLSSQKKGLGELGREILNKVHGESPEEIIAFVSKKLASIDAQGAPLSLSSARDAASKAVASVMNAKNKQQRAGITSGIDEYDVKLGGLQAGELVILAARPACGKTSLGMQTARANAATGNRVLVISCEMSDQDLALRIIAGDANVNSVDIRSGTYSDDDLDRIVKAADEFAAMPLTILDMPRCKVADIRRAARQVIREHGELALVVVDYLGLITSSMDSRVPRHLQVGEVTQALKEFAREMRIPVLVMAQLSRESENAKNGRPRLSHLRESGNIEQDADVVMFIHRPELYQPEDPDLKNKAELIVEKNRNGPILDIDLMFSPERTRFYKKAIEYREFF